jgi:hypothetical protein
MPQKIEPVTVDFGEDTNNEIAQYIYDQLDSLEKSHTDLHRNKIPKWRRLYLGTPSENVRSFPFPNAANTIVQVVGETVDTMIARVMGLLYATHPLWVFQNYAKEKDPQAIAKGEQRHQVLQDFMDLVGYEPSELDLYRIEGQWFTDTARLGTGFVKASLEDNVEAVVVGYDEATSKIKGKETTIYKGPKITKLRHEDVLVNPNFQTVDDANFIAVRRSLNKFQIEERGFTGAFDQDAVEAILDKPDRSVPRDTVQQENQQQGVTAVPTPDLSTAEWDIYEVHLAWWHNGRKYWLIYHYHKLTRTVMRKVFNFMPNNRRPIFRAKLGYRTDGMYGHGYAELLENYQEELSTTHNQRLDNATVANTRALRISPRARALDSNVELYPTALIIGEKDEVETLQVGDVYPSTFKNEEMTLGLVARRAGITPAQSGMGTGGMMKRPAIYTAQGTLAVLQETNSVVGHATSEFRHAHVTLGGALVEMYAQFGTNGREEMFGIDKDRLNEALQEFLANRMRIPIRAASGSLNKEVDKQTGMLMAGLMQRQYTAVGQLMQAIANPMVPPPTRKYFMGVVMASNLLHKRILKDFGYEQPDIYVPEVENEQQNQGTVQGGQVAPGGAPMAGGGAPAPAPSQSGFANPNMAASVAGLTTSQGAGH